MSAQPVPASSIQLQIGGTFDLPKSATDLGFIGDAAAGYVQLSHNGSRTLHLQRFDPDLNLSAEGKIVSDGFLAGEKMESILNFGGRHYLIYQDTKFGSLRAAQIDLSNLTLKPKSEHHTLLNRALTALPMSKDSWGSGIHRSSLGSGQYSVTAPPGQRNILVQYEVSPGARAASRAPEAHFMVVLDSNFRQIREHQIRMPYARDMVDKLSFQTDAAGSIYLLARVYDAPINSLEFVRRSHTEVLCWKAGAEVPATYKVEIPDARPDNPKLLQHDTEGMTVVGYRGDPRFTAVYGAYLVDLALRGGELVATAVHSPELPLRSLAAIMPQQLERSLSHPAPGSRDSGLANLELVKVCRQADGSVDLIGEQREVYFVNGSANYAYGGIAVMRFDAAGGLAWRAFIPKNQERAINSQGMSFRHFAYGGQHYFLYLDWRSNLERGGRPPAKMMMDASKAYLIGGRLDEGGKLHTEAVLSQEKTGLRVTVGAFRDAGPAQLICRTRTSGREGKPVLLRFD